MWKNLLVVVLLAVLCSNVGLCRRRSSATRKWPEKTVSQSSTESPTPLGNLCYGSEMIDNMILEANDTIFYKNNAKEFPNGLFYPNCSLPLQPKVSRETRTEECVDFIIASSNLTLPNGKNASDPRERVMWLVINHLCASETCSLPCPGSSNVSSAHYFLPILMTALVGYSILATQ